MKNQFPKDPAPAVAPSKLNLWLFMMASSMLFAAVLSAFIVHGPDAEKKNAWTVFDLPIYFFYSLIIVIISSITIQYAFNMAKKDELSANRWLIGATWVLGILFCLSQFLGWKQLVALDLTFVNSRPEDISASYVYVITALHVVHVIGGIVLLSISWVQAMKFNVHKKSLTLMSITNTYWHFVGLLWILLYLFLYFAK